MTWQSADAMHFTLGEEGLARRALGLHSCPEQSGSSEKGTETKPNSTLNTVTPQSQNYRTRHFDATSAPHIQMTMSVAPQPSQVSASLASIPKVSDVSLNCSALSFQGEIGSIDGKRQVTLEFTH